ncbi:SixA phosphatase family protein [Gordonia shandongensis]|uniref:SixA phosphatase family protein n=1 Tax=Gordonia shandongensis TaxID=376351 RepID=UPI00047A8927|nr:histidine phosphatase family protein [Gordonia shandongensis]
MPAVPDRTLVLLRHGKSAYPAGVADHDRPLNERGLRQAALAGEWLAADGLHVDAVLCSTAVRTRQTLDRTGVEAPARFVADLYGATPWTILETLRIDAPSDASVVLVVGHFPGLPETALTLDPGATIDRFPTSAYAVVGVGVPWDRVGLDADPDGAMTSLRIPR